MTNIGSEDVRGGVLTISLDFELEWGMRDVSYIAEYRRNLHGARRAIPQLLDLFEEFEIKATWATVGFLFARDRRDLEDRAPTRRPTYTQSLLNPYPEVANVGGNELESPLHLAPSLIHLINETPGQEIGSHTFSHYYCLAEGQGIEDFRADLEAAQQAALQLLGRRLRSLVFPRNQVSPRYLAACGEAGFTGYRGAPNVFFLKPSATRGSRVSQAARLIDQFVPLAGPGTVPIPSPAAPVNVPATRQLRPVHRLPNSLQILAQRRLQRSLTMAAQRNHLCHIWWHPHNFGVGTAENLSHLREFLVHYKRCADEYGTVSASMGDVVRLASSGGVRPAA